MLELRDIVPADSAAFAEQIIRLAQESPYTLLTAEEAQGAAKCQAERTRELITSPQQWVLLALHTDRPVGFIGLRQGALARNAHVASLTMGVLAAHQQRGIGTRLLQEGLSWARARNIVRVELGVMTDNAKAIRLYERLGFTIEGTRQSALRLEDGYADEYVKAKVLK